MWGDNNNNYNNSTNYGLGFNSPCIMCHAATVPCSCTNPMIRWYNNVPVNQNNYLNYQRAPESNIYAGFSHASNLVNPPLHVENDHEVSVQMGTNEIDSWLMSNPDNNQSDGSLNLRSYGFYNGHQCQGGHFIHMQTQGIQTSLLSMVAGIVPEATIGTADLPQEWALNQFSFPPFYPGNLIKETVGTYSNSTSMSSVGTQQQISLDDLHNPSEHPPMSRQDRILRYFEKKKARKYEKRVAYSSRKTYAQTRPRIRGRFARSSHTDANDKTAVLSGHEKKSTSLSIDYC